MQIRHITHPTLRYGFARIAPLFTAGILIAPSLSAQATSDIFISKITGGDDGPRFSTPVNITHREGYDNQPSFTPDGRAILYTSIRDGQADSWRYDIALETLTRITTTPESEYSPTVMPSGTTFSAVRVEADSTQRLWSFDLDGDNPQILLHDIKPVGYHAWADASTLALFVLGQPPTLQLADVTSGTARVMASNIGRAFGIRTGW